MMALRGRPRPTDRRFGSTRAQSMALHGSPDPFVARVYLAAAKVGGIWANDRYPAEFIYQNLMIEANVIHAPRFLPWSATSEPSVPRAGSVLRSTIRWANQDSCRPQLGQIAGLHDLAAYPRQSAVGLVHVTRPDPLDPTNRKVRNAEPPGSPSPSSANGGGQGRPSRRPRPSVTGNQPDVAELQVKRQINPTSSSVVLDAGRSAKRTPRTPPRPAVWHAMWTL